MRLVRSVLLPALGVALVSQPASAAADRLTHRDPVGDVASSPIGSRTYSPAPTQVEGDIASVRVVHAPRMIWVRVQFRDLTTTSNGNFHVVAIRSDRRFRSVSINAFPGHWEGQATTVNSGGVAVPCPVGHRIDHTLHRVVLRVPRACLGKPRWVRVAVRSTVAGRTRAYADDGWARGLPAGLVYGPRVRH